MKRLYSIIFAFLLFNLSAQAQFITCPTGTYTRGEVYAHAVNDQIYWASRRDVTGTIVTTDGGNTWTLSSFTDPRNFPVYCIHAFNANTAFVVASTIYKTTDRGNTWTPATGLYTNSASFPNTIHFFDQNNGVAMGDPVDGYFEIYTTTNGGVNWVRVPSNNIPAPLTGETGYVSMHTYYNNSYWFTTSNARIFRSTDHGYTWTCYQFPQATGLGSIAFRDELHGLSECVIGSNWNYYKTSDGGSNWTYVSSWPSWMYGYFTIQFIPGTQSIYAINSISYSGNELKAMVLFTNNDGMTWHRMDDWGLYSYGDWIDYGQWTSVNSGWGSFYGANQGCIYHWPGYSGKHIWRASDHLNYNTRELTGVDEVFEISVGNYGTEALTINSFSLFSSHYILINPPTLPLSLQPWDAVDVSIAFSPVNRGLLKDSLIILSDAANHSSLSVALTGKALQFTPPLEGLIYAASDSLYTFNLANLNPEPVGRFDFTGIEQLAVRPDDSLLIGISKESKLYKIDPVVGGCLEMVPLSVTNIRAIAYSPSGSLFAGQKNGTLYKINANTGEAIPIGTPSGKIYSSFAFNKQDGKLYASVSPVVGSSKDAIYTIDTLTGAATLLGLTGDGKATPSIAFNDDGKLYGLKGTLSETNRIISISTIDGSGTEIGSLEKSGLQAIFMLGGVTDIGNDRDDIKLTSYQLFQNYPNPFNPNTTISWQSPVGSNQTIKLFDVLGNEIATLIDEYKPAGRYEVEFNAEKLSSGIYFYQLNAGNFMQAKKMILLK